MSGKGLSTWHHMMLFYCNLYYGLELINYSELFMGLVVILIMENDLIFNYSTSLISGYRIGL